MFITDPKYGSKDEKNHSLPSEKQQVKLMKLNKHWILHKQIKFSEKFFKVCETQLNLCFLFFVFGFKSFIKFNIYYM